MSISLLKVYITALSDITYPNYLNSIRGNNSQVNGANVKLLDGNTMPPSIVQVINSCTFLDDICLRYISITVKTKWISRSQYFLILFKSIQFIEIFILYNDVSNYLIESILYFRYLLNDSGFRRYHNHKIINI